MSTGCSIIPCSARGRYWAAWSRFRETACSCAGTPCKRWVAGMIDVAGAIGLYVQLPRRLTTWTSGLLTAGVLLAMLVELRGRVWAVASVLVRSGLFSLHRLIVVPLAIHRYLRSAITGHTVWEKTTHGIPVPPREHDL